MVDAIIIILVVILILFAIKSSVKHFKGEGACCGGRSPLVKSDDKVLEQMKLGEKIVKIEGMQCEHCVENVKRAINKIDGASAKVNLHEEEAIVSYDREVSDECITKAITDAGYKVISIR